MSGWREIKLKDVCERITVGHVGSMAAEYKDDGVPFLRSLNITPFKIRYENIKHIDANFHQKLKKSALKPGDVVVVRTGYPGTACVIPKSFPDSNCSDLVIVKTGGNLNPYFLTAIFNSTFGKDLVSGNLVGAAQQHFNITVAKELKLKIPSKNSQDKIAGVLSAYDDLIENNQRRIALLEKMAEEIYREWFVRMRFPGHKQVKFEKGVPEGWEYKELNKLCSLIKRGISPKYDDESKSLVINQRCIRDGNVDLSVARGHETKIPKEKMIKYGDVLINSTGVGTLGRVSVLEYEVANLTCDTHVTICRADSNLVNVHFLAHTVKRLQSHFENMAIGSTGQTELGRELVANTKVLLPTLAVQNAFSEQAAEIWKMKRYLSGMLKTLEQTRDSLLPRLISGKLSVENLDIHFPPSMRDNGHDQKKRQ